MSISKLIREKLAQPQDFEPLFPRPAQRKVEQSPVEQQESEFTESAVDMPAYTPEDFTPRSTQINTPDDFAEDTTSVTGYTPGNISSLMPQGLSSEIFTRNVEKQTTPYEGTTLRQGKTRKDMGVVGNTILKIYDLLNKPIEVTNPIEKKILALGAGAEKLIEPIRRLTDPELNAQLESIREQEPITAKAGEFAAYTAPFSLAGKVVNKAIPTLANPAKTLLGRIGQGAAHGGLSGALVGGAEGALDKGVDYIQGNANAQDILKGTATSAGEMGLGGAVIGGALGAAGYGLEKFLNRRRYIPPLPGEPPGGGAPPTGGGTPPTGAPPTGGGTPPTLAERLVKKSSTQEPSINEGLPERQLTSDMNSIEVEQILKRHSNIKTEADLPDSVPELQQYVDDMQRVIESRPKKDLIMLDINLQLFAQAKNKLLKIVPHQQDKPLNLKESFSDVYNSFVDNINPLNKFGKAAGNENVYMKGTNAKKAYGTTDYIINEKLVDLNGIEKGKGLKEIVEKIPKNKEKTFWQYMLMKHAPARQAQGKHLYPESTDLVKLDRLRQKIETRHPEFLQIDAELRTFLKDYAQTYLVDSGRLTQKAMNEIWAKYPHWIPTQREFSELEKGLPQGANTGYVNQSSGIQTATGSDRNVYHPLENIMMFIDRNVKEARRNATGQEIVKAIQADPQKTFPYVEIVPKNFASQEEFLHFQKGDMSLDNMVNVRVNGKNVALMFKNKPLLDTVLGRNALDLGKSSNKVVRTWQGGIQLFKDLITNKNPLFSVVQAATDIPQAYMFGSSKNPIQFFGDLAKAGKSILKNDASYKQYKALGNQASRYFEGPKVTDYRTDMSKKKSLPQKMVQKVDDFNSFFDALPRMAEFSRVLKNGGTLDEALYKAGDVTINFGRGGNIAKKVDINFVPYLNVSIQALNRLARAVKSNPKQVLRRGAVALTIPTIATEAWNQLIDPEGYASLNNRDKDAFFLIATGDEDMPFIKIPKTRALGVVFSSLFQRIYRAVQGEAESFSGFGNTVATSFAPTNPVENNIYSPFINLARNKDFADRPIVSPDLLDLSAEYQSDERTSILSKAISKATAPIARELTEKFELSPMQIDYLIRSYTGVVGALFLPLMSEDRSGANILKRKFVADPSYSNQNVTDFYDILKRAKTKAADRNFLDNVPSKAVTPEEMERNYFDKQAKKISRIRKVTKDETPEVKKVAKKDINEIAKRAVKLYRNER